MKQINLIPLLFLFYTLFSLPNALAVKLEEEQNKDSFNVSTTPDQYTFGGQLQERGHKVQKIKNPKLVLRPCNHEDLLPLSEQDFGKKIEGPIPSKTFVGKKAYYLFEREKGNLDAAHILSFQDFVEPQVKHSKTSPLPLICAHFSTEKKDFNLSFLAPVLFQVPDDPFQLAYWTFQVFVKTETELNESRHIKIWNRPSALIKEPITTFLKEKEWTLYEKSSSEYILVLVKENPPLSRERLIIYYTAD